MILVGRVSHPRQRLSGSTVESFQAGLLDNGFEVMMRFVKLND